MNNRESQQVINFDQIDEGSPILIHSHNVVIHPSSKTLEDDSKASNKITIKNVVDYSWEDRYTLGHLISYHPHTCLIAYVLSISNNYMIRILNEQHSGRCLIKDFTGEITDIAFSKSHIPYVASIDINGSVKVNKVNISAEVIECQLILNIKPVPSLESVKSMKVSYSRVMWCWHNDVDPAGVEESDGVGTNISLLLGVVHGSTFEVMQIDTIENELSQSNKGQYEPRIDRMGLRAISSSFQEQFYENESLADLFLPYLVYTAPGDDSKITSLAISSDAAAFAVALRDGTVRFFTLDGSVPSGLKEAYSWRPFNGEAVWSLLFLDDCRPESNIDSFWCHVVVGGAFNRELKLFRCDKWDCIQTISFQSPVTPCLLSAHIDQSARFLIMSDIRRKALYVLELDSIDNNKTKLFKNVQEFVLTQSLLSFDINTITSNVTSDEEKQIIIKMFTITKGAFQKMRVSYVSRGHRLNEILVDINDETPDHNTQHVELDQLPVSNSLLTHVSSLPSANSSFQDPAIISTQMHSNLTLLQSLPTEMPPTLQHLFSGAKDRKRCVNDSGDESGDEASLAELILPRKKDTNDSEEENGNSSHRKNQIPITDNKFPVSSDMEEECGGFPLPPCATNSGWNSTSNVQFGSIGTAEADQLSEQPNIIVNGSDELSTLSRLEALMRMQMKQMEILTSSVKKLQNDNQNNLCRCNCKEMYQQQQKSGERMIEQIVKSCKQSIIECLDQMSLSERMECIISRSIGELNVRLDETIRIKLASVESTSRDFLNSLLHDKKFIAYIANIIADCLDKPLRAAYLDMCRKELAPALGKTIDRLFADTRDVLGNGIKEVLSSVNEANKGSLRNVDEHLKAGMTTLQKSLGLAITGELNSRLTQLMNEMSVSRSILNDGFNKQRGDIDQLNQMLQSMKESINSNGDYRMKNSHVLSQANSMVNINVNDQQIREQKLDILIISGDFTSALNEALSMTDIRILLKVCSRINTKAVLSCNSQKPSHLQSSSILALIQQLSRDFHERFEIKFEYLFDALLSLDTNEVGIKLHVGKVLKGAARRLQNYLDRENSPALKDKVAMLLRIVTSRLDSSMQE